MFNLSFTNPGEIDIRGATIAGLSAKTTSTAIGEFGTGLKYAIACALRWQGEITIWSGRTKHEFSAEVFNFRGTDFQQIVMRTFTNPGAPIITTLDCTTEYGKKWLPWQIFRELEANARDEGGSSSIGFTPPSPGTTVIHISCDDLREPFTQRNTIILPAERLPIHTTDDCQVFAHSSNYLYYKGVRVRAITSSLTYNILSGLTLTEDRSLEHLWSASRIVAECCALFTDEAMIFKVLNPMENSFESDLSWSEYNDYSPEFIEVACRLFAKRPSKYRALKALVAKHQPQLLLPTPVQLSPVRQKMLDKAIRLVAQMGMSPAQFSIVVADLGPDTLGQFNAATGLITLSPNTFEQGTKQVLSTLYEELVHAETGKADCNYDMQTYLFNRIVSLHEEHIFGEPI